MVGGQRRFRAVCNRRRELSQQSGDGSLPIRPKDQDMAIAGAFFGTNFCPLVAD